MYHIGFKGFGVNWFLGELNHANFIELEQVQWKMLNTEQDPCNQDISYKNWIRCMENAFEMKRGCRFPWLAQNDNGY